MSGRAGETRRPPAPGSSYGPYTIIESLGAGGMGEVFRARDAKLNRHVALKFLPEELSSDEQLLARFQREAKLLALVSHPNIATIHNIEDDYDNTFLVLELVEGETLANTLKRGPLPLREALRVCRDIAAALEAAHRKGIVHRDLKPANVIVTPEGVPKVLDFGIARPVEFTQAASDLEQTPSQELTATGTIIGTGPYMSPEQVRGKVAGRRADIWAFGCLMYQALTGKAAFQSDTLADTLTSILERDPDWSLLPAKTPESIRRLMQRCVQKDPSQRLQAIGDARIEIEEAIRDPAGVRELGIEAGAPPWQLAVGAAVILALGVAIGAFATWLGRPEEAPVAPQVFDFALPDNMVLGLGGAPSIAVSRDGAHFVAALRDGNSRSLYRRDRYGSGAWQRIPATEGAEAPFFSWSGDEIAYFSRGTLYRVPYDGSEDPVTVAPAAAPYGGAWAADGTIFFSANQNLWAIAPGTTQPAEIAEFDIDKRELGLRWPFILPDGVTLMYTGWTGLDSTGSTRSTLYMRSANETPSVVYENVGYTRYSPAGYLIATRADRLVALPFDAGSRRVNGTAMPVSEAVLVRSEDIGVPFFDVAPLDGTFVYAPGGALTSGPELVKMSAVASSVPVPVDLEIFYENLLYPRISAGDELAVTADTGDGSSSAVVVGLGGGANAEVLVPRADTYGPEWSPADDRVAFVDAGESEIRTKQAHTPGAGTTLLQGEQNIPPLPTSWSAAGMLLFNRESYTEGSDGVTRDVYYIDTDSGTSSARPFLTSDDEEYGATVSPRGDLVAYTRRPRGEERSEVVVTSFPDHSQERTVSAGSDCQEPAWASDERLFFRCGNEMRSVGIDRQPLRYSESQLLWRWPLALDDTFSKANYAYDTRREVFYMVSQEPIPPQFALKVVLDWSPVPDTAGR